MKDFLAPLSMIVVLISVVGFFIGLLMVCFESQRKLGLKILITSVIAFVIGFGTCVATFSLNI